MKLNSMFYLRGLVCAAAGLLVSTGVNGMDDLNSTVGRPGAAAGTSELAQAPPISPLSANDVSWLFPAPRQAADFGKIIAMNAVTAQNVQDPTKRDPVWSNAAFQQFIAIAGSPAAQVAGTPNRIGLAAEVQSMDAWFIAGVRIDAGAPGLPDDMQGALPQPECYPLSRWPQPPCSSRRGFGGEADGEAGQHGDAEGAG